jgi:hypothetical protein
VHIVERGFSEANVREPETVERRYRFEVAIRDDLVISQTTNDLLEPGLSRRSPKPFESLIVRILHVPRVRVDPDSVFLRLSEESRPPIDRSLLVVVEPPIPGFRVSAVVEPRLSWLEANVERAGSKGGTADGRTFESSGVSEGPLTGYRVRVRVKDTPEEFDPTTGFAKGEVHIRTNDSDHAKISVPIVVAMKKDTR